ncbi:MAG: 5'/3'-nucleotidase SurE [Candidatus Aminicenantes bacterium]|jgi:5'-nucleotidase
MNMNKQAVSVSRLQKASQKVGSWILLKVLFILVLSMHPIFLNAQKETGKSAGWLRRVLLTNDDGISETRLWALGKAFSKVSATYIVASFEDRSGTSNVSGLGKYKRSLFVKREYMSENLVAYGVAGYPADCVAFGIKGLLKDQPPDLVVSGINSGPNLGDDAWFGSGTIGAARAAAFLGFPAIAVSGLDDDDKEMVRWVTQWVVRFAQSKIVKELKPGEYLTVSIPTVRPSEIKGIKIVQRTPSVRDFQWEKVWEEGEESDDETEAVWIVRVKGISKVPPSDSDGVWYRKGYIVIVPMRVGENDEILVNKLRTRKNELPEWPLKKQ